MRAAGDQPARAVVWLTILGAFASPIFIPLTAWLVDALGWQGTLRVQAALTLLVFAGAALASPGHASGSAHRTHAHGRARDALAAAWRGVAFRRWIAASVVSGAAIDIILVNQVPAMIAAGLSVGAAATIGGLRGLAQLGGRPSAHAGAAPPRHTGDDRHHFPGRGCRRGAAVAQRPRRDRHPLQRAGRRLDRSRLHLQGIYTHELVGDADLGLVMGAQQALFATGGAVGPALAGILLATTHSYTPALLVTVAAFLVAACTIATGGRPRPSGL